MNIHDFLFKSFKDNNGLCNRKRLVCNDEFSISIQGSKYHYCSPRETQDWYNEIEAGYPSEKEGLILQFAERPEIPTDTVYGWVPVDIIQQVIEKHGGINIEETFKN